MRIYVPSVVDGCEWVLPVHQEGHNRFPIESGEPVADSWEPLKMELLRHDGGSDFLPADFPWLGRHTLVMRESAAEVVAPLIAGQGELLPATCDEGDLFLLHVTQTIDALDQHRSDVVRFGSGRIMKVQNHVFHKQALEGVQCFRDTSLLRGSTFLSQALVEAIEVSGLTGFGADLVWDG